MGTHRLQRTAQRAGRLSFDGSLEVHASEREFDFTNSNLISKLLDDRLSTLNWFVGEGVLEILVLEVRVLVGARGIWWRWIRESGSGGGREKESEKGT